ncbi:MAG TPA: DcrB-related protein [Herpetosiphonaceae bacterium]
MQLSLRFQSLPRFIYLALAVLLLSSCGSAAAPEPAATIAAGALPNGWQQIDLPPVSLALPAEWSITDAGMIDSNSAVTEMAGQNPQLKTVLEQGRAALVSGQIQLIAYDLELERLSETGFPTNFRLGRQILPETATLDKVSDANEQDLRNTPGFSEVTRTPVAIGNLDATRLTSKLEIKDAIGNPLALAFEQYVLVSRNDVFVLTFTAPAEVQPSYRTTFDQILGTLRID